MSGTWPGDWLEAEGPDGEALEVSADGTQVRVDGVIYLVVDVVAVPVDLWGQERLGGWS